MSTHLCVWRAHGFIYLMCFFFYKLYYRITGLFVIKMLKWCFESKICSHTWYPTVYEYMQSVRLRNCERMHACTFRPVETGSSVKTWDSWHHLYLALHHPSLELSAFLLPTFSAGLHFTPLKDPLFLRTSLFSFSFSSPCALAEVLWAAHVRDVIDKAYDSGGPGHADASS